MNNFIRTLILLPLITLSTAGSTTSRAKRANFVNVEKRNQVTFTKDSGKRVSSTSGEYATTTDADYFIMKKTVNEGERYIANFKINSDNYVAFAFTDASNNVVYSYKSFSDNYKAREYNSCSITVPDRATNMYINCAKSYESDAKLWKLSIEEELLDDYESFNIDKEEVVFGANNIGEFDYGNTSYTNDQYKEHWTTMLTDTKNKFDFFSFEDLCPTYLDGSSTKELLKTGGKQWNQLPSYGEFFALSTQIKPIDSAMLPLPFSTGGKTSKRFMAFRNTFLINGLLTATYTVHLVAEGHISTTLTDKQGNVINYLSQQLRQNQFQTIMKDAKAYDAAVIMGDFNAQKADEYESWVRAGYNICNGSKEYGEVLTLLRDPNGPDKNKPSIPADNIIVTGNLKIKAGSFRKLDTYNLNTDHRPVMATVIFGE